MRGLTGKTAIVTGGGSGIGRAISLRLAKEGCNGGVLDVNEAGARETVAQMPKDAGLALKCDITDYDAVAQSVKAVEDRFGGVDILVNNVGWDKALPFLESDFTFWKKVVDINLYGALNMHYAVLPIMLKRNYGKVVNIASDAGRVGSSGEAVYSACKGGVIAFTKTMARELSRSNIRLNTVCPGPTDTPLFESFIGTDGLGPKIREGLKRSIPLRRLGEPDDYPGIVAFLASEDANFITGQTISVSGGLTMHG
ncbi:MAG: glucose 1-dehydrogenase [Reyranellaceae bacterium]